MYFEYKEKEGYTEVSAETNDICVMCKLFDSCPLLGALETNLVYPSADIITIENCPIYIIDLENNSLNN